MNNILIDRSRNSTTARIETHAISRFLTTCDMSMKTWQNLAILEGNVVISKPLHTSGTTNLLILNSSFTYIYLEEDDYALFGLDFMSMVF